MGSDLLTGFWVAGEVCVLVIGEAVGIGIGVDEKVVVVVVLDGKVLAGFVVWLWFEEFLKNEGVL